VGALPAVLMAWFAAVMAVAAMSGAPEPAAPKYQMIIIGGRH
jgi:hypothetical protein